MYLISTQTLMDMICGHPDVVAWSRTVSPGDVGASVVTLGQIEAEVLRTPQSDGRANLDSALRTFHALARRTRRIEPFDEAAASDWAKIMDFNLPTVLDGEATDLGDMSRMVVATALSRGLTLVERTQPYHGLLSNLAVLDPY